MCRKVLSISREVDSRTSLGSLFHCFLIPKVKFFLIFRWTHLCLSLFPLHFVLSVVTTEKSLAPLSWHLPWKHLCALLRSPLSFLFSRLDKPSSLSLSSQKRFSSALPMFIALHWTLSSNSLSFLNWGAQNWVRYSRHGLIRAEQSGRISSLILLATVFLINPRTSLSFLATRPRCWIMVNMFSNRTPCSTELLSSRSAWTDAWDFSFPGAGPYICVP